MIQTQIGNMFLNDPDLVAFKLSPAQHIRIQVHCTNCLGIMGGGIAAEIRERFPIVYEVYRKKFLKTGLVLGEIQPVKINENLYIVNANGQLGIRSFEGEAVVCYDAVRSNFKLLQEFIQEEFYNTFLFPVTVSVEFPLFGCGLAGGDWNIVSNIIDEEINDPRISKILWTLK